MKKINPSLKICIKNIAFFYSVFIFSILLASCNLCKLNGETKLGNSFSLVESDKDHIAIVYCTSSLCCDVGIPIVPSNIIEYNSNSKWIIAKTMNATKNHYWLIDKDFSVKFDNTMRKKILSHVLGPIDSVLFFNKLKEHNINLPLKNLN